MRQIVLEEPGLFKDELVELPESPAEGWVLLRTGAVGMCGTDYHAYMGKQNFFTYPRVLGHEIGATVVALGEGVETLSVGDRCCVVPYWGCGTCVACRRGKTNCCTNISVLGVHAHGALREYFLAPASMVVASRSLPLEQLALVETLCIGAHAVFRGAPKPGDTALVIGAGPIGMATAQFAQAEGAKVAIMDINDARLEFVKSAVGIEHTINSMSCDDVKAEVEKIFGGELPTHVWDATGNIHSMKGAFNFVSHGGTLVFVGHTKERLAVENPLFHAREMTVMGSRNALPEDFARVVSLIEDGKVDVSPWITHRCTFDDFEESFKHWMTPEAKVIKGIVTLHQ
jgi:2-desacetyl-2-hydroxyethyl bacteriochlorophyllide A dehydrogenase